MAKTHRTTARAIPRDVKESLIALALLEARARRISRAVKATRQRIAREMPAGVRASLKEIQHFVREHNRLCAGTGAGIPIPMWLVKQRNGVKAVQA